MTADSEASGTRRLRASGSTENSQDYFSRVAPMYTKLSRWTTAPDLVSAELALIRARAADAVTVADLGAGSGAFAALLRREDVFPSGVLVALDLSYDMLADRSSGLSRQRVVADARALPFASGSLDRIVIRQLLHYVDPDLVLREVRRVLGPGGVVHLTQQTDYDDVPDEWYARWTKLRGAASRRRLSNRGLVAAAHRTGLVELEHTFQKVKLAYSWGELAAKYGLCGREEIITGFFRAAPERARDRYDLTLNAEGVGYTSQFRISVLRSV